MAQKKVSPVKTGKCETCKDKRILHIGDLIASAGNKTHFSHSHVFLAAEDRGLRVQGTIKGCKIALLNPNGALKKHLNEAQRHAKLVLTPEEFEAELKRVCRGTIPIERKNPSFESRLGPGKRIYLLGLTSGEEQIIREMCKVTKTKIGKMRKPSLSAVVTNNKMYRGGRADYFRFLKVPVYKFERIK